MEQNNIINQNNIVISSRVRLARNLKNIKFLNKMSQEDAYKIIDDVKLIIDSNETMSKFGFKLYYLKDIPDIELNILVEKHIISAQLVNNKNKSAYLISENKKIIIMINEEDHIRIQVINDNFNIEGCLKIANEIDDILEEKLEFAFDKKLGYISSCPTNLGTGMRSSTMLHLPALAMTNQLERMLIAVSQIGVAVRGVYGEGTKSMGNLYQISNQGTLGAQEETLVERIRQITMQLVEKEIDTRNKLLTNNRIYIEDEVYRAYGILKNARIIQNQEAMQRLSMVKMGIEMGILNTLESKDIDNLMVKVQENSVQMQLDSGFTQKERNLKRADILRKEVV
ncbi:protein arginine kinase [Sedimentibacter sp. zth1]|uniref:protein arginine kinase n=1 Tax=Sedimentibacter sp. zth1 TaxID=2816908 RepID=UPI001A92AD6F|nr:protein arginine kinase [Sedimentibacter sp. zth1]QSX07208.1 protein arginine kinase [Sedimentibacter sp. zth1]